MGHSENPTEKAGKQARPKRKRRRPRSRPCLLKGCERRYRPRRARQRYCSPECRTAARKWSGWKAQQRYRGTRLGQHQRNGQSRRYRERVGKRQEPLAQAVEATARVITPESFRALL